MRLERCVWECGDGGDAGVWAALQRVGCKVRALVAGSTVPRDNNIPVYMDAAARAHVVHGACAYPEVQTCKQEALSIGVTISVLRFALSR